MSVNLHFWPRAHTRGMKTEKASGRRGIKTETLVKRQRSKSGKGGGASVAGREEAVVLGGKAMSS